MARKKGEKFYMYSTGIDVDKSSAQMNQVLSRVGATHIVTEYDPATHEAIGVYFVISMDGKRASFSIPIKWENVQKAMIKSKVQKQFLYEEQYKRVAWRVALRWVEAQVALIQSGGAETAEAFMGYAVVDNKGTTLYQQLKGTGFKQLPAPQGP